MNIIPKITFSMIQFKAIFAYKFVAFRTIFWCFLHAYFSSFFFICTAHHIFLRDVCSLGNAFPLNARHSFLCCSSSSTIIGHISKCSFGNGHSFDTQNLFHSQKLFLLINSCYLLGCG